MKLKKPNDVLHLSKGDIVTKRNLFDLIQYSKVEGSGHWEGEENKIGNTPQQGINWLGNPPNCKAVIIKARLGSYQDDGWQGHDQNTYHYSFKAVNNRISYLEKANSVLINQPKYRYPVLLFTEQGNAWSYEGSFEVSELQERYIVLERGHSAVQHGKDQTEESTKYSEGDRKYVTHLMVERNTSVVGRLKAVSDSVCDICRAKLLEIYGVDCIEAHHKTPISTYSSSHDVSLNDFVLLCPNCHRAVHKYMQKQCLEYSQIKEVLRSKASQQATAGDR